MFATMRGRSTAADAADEAGTVHYQGVGLVGTDTLCGHVDRTDFDWHDTKKRANCKGCLAVRDHVLGRAKHTQDKRGNET